MHEVIIYLVIVAVVAVQLGVGFRAWMKIDLYRDIIPDMQNFKIVKVYIREDQVKDIDISYVLNNLHKFGAPVLPNPEPEQSVHTEAIPVSTDVNAIADTSQQQSFEFNEEEIGYEDLIWVARGNEEMKIKYKLLRSHEQAGWRRI